MIKACIFDLDGTLADTVESIAHGVNHTLAQFGLEPRPVGEYNYYAGDGIDMALARALQAAGDAELNFLHAGIPVTREYFAGHSLYKVKPYPGIVAVLEALKRARIRTAVFSNKPHGAAVEVVEALFGKECFDRIQGQTEKIPKKPDPTGALALAAYFGLKPGEILYLGDTDTDMKTGCRAGMFTVGVTWGFRPRRELEENGAMALVDHPAEILDLIREKNAKRDTVRENDCGGNRC